MVFRKFDTTTNITNVGIVDVPLDQPGIGPAARAFAKFKRDLQQLSFWVHDALNWNCRVERPDQNNTVGDRQRIYLRNLSKYSVDPLDTMLSLVRLSPSEPFNTRMTFPELTVTDHQAQRLFDNLRVHGAMVSALENCIDEMERRDDSPAEFLEAIRTLRDNQASVAHRLMKRTDHGQGHLKVHVDEKESGEISEIVNSALAKVRDGDCRDPRTILEQELIQAKIRNRASTGTREQRKFNAKLLTLRNQLDRKGTIDPKALQVLLGRALGMAGAAKSEAGIYANSLSKIGSSEALLTLTTSLFGAMSDVAAGSKSASQSLMNAITAIRLFDDAPIVPPRLADARTKHASSMAICDLARYSGGDDALIVHFNDAVVFTLAEQNFRGEWAKAFLAQADELRLDGRNLRVREIMHEVLSHPEMLGEDDAVEANDGFPKASTAKPSDVGIEPLLEPADEASRIAEPGSAGHLAADTTVFAYILLPCFVQFGQRLETGEQVDIGQEIGDAVQSAPPDEIVLIRDFFMRHSWMPDHFISSESQEDQLFGLICNAFIGASSMLSADEGERSSELLTKLRQRRFIDIIKAWGFDSTADLLGLELTGLRTPGALPGALDQYIQHSESIAVFGMLDVQDPLEFLELLDELAETARQVSINDSDETFRERVVSLVSPALNQIRGGRYLESLKRIILNYPAFGNRRPGTLAAKQPQFKNTDPTSLAPAVQRLDRMGIVADVFRELLDLGHGGASASAVRQLTSYSTRILLKNGDVQLALKELRQEESPRPALLRSRTVDQTRRRR